DDRACGFRLHDGLDRRQRLVKRPPAVVLSRVLERGEAALEVQRGASTLTRLLVGVVGHTVTVCKVRAGRKPCGKNGVRHPFSSAGVGSTRGAAEKGCLTPFFRGLEKGCLAPSFRSLSCGASVAAGGL